MAALEETSGMSGGAVAGASGNFNGKKRKKNQNSVIRQENVDLNLVDSVVRLIMERGILQ